MVPSRTSCPSWLKGFAVAFAFGFAIGVAFDFAVGVAFLWPMACCLLPIASSLFGFPPLFLCALCLPRRAVGG
jgi:cytochrome bd-type quinol oxidase subunit 1